LESQAGSAVVAGHRHDRAVSDDCAACRFLLLSSARCEPTALCLTEQVSILSTMLAVAAWGSQPLGLYRSRAPPALS
jgi:hypothetical protein